MSNLKYKVGDRFKDLDEEIIEFEIKAVDPTHLKPYYIEFYKGLDVDAKKERFKEVFIDKYYTKIKDPLDVVWDDGQSKMNIEENKHHLLWQGMQSIDVMKSALTRTEYIGFLKGQILKYQLRLGKKDDVSKELKKIQDYTNELNKMLDEEKNN
tara:strand:- start:26 stop:487 length:462 start_codon:yes stop_codon:yes gene_type:complete